MDPKLIRRQFTLILILAGIAYLWWQSQRPSRYAEWTEDLDIDAASEWTWPQDSVDWSNKAGLIYSSRSDSLSIVVWSAASQGGYRHRIEHRVHDIPRRRIYLEMDSAGTIGFLALREADGHRADIVADSDSAQVHSYDSSGTTRWIPWPENAVFYEGLAVQASAWIQNTDEQPATLIRYDTRTGVILQYPVTIQPTSDTTRTLWSGDRFVAKVGYAPGNPHTQTICDATDRCWVLTDAYYTSPNGGDSP